MNQRIKDLQAMENEAYRRYEAGEIPRTAVGMADGERTAGYGECRDGYYTFPLQVDQETGEILV
jgi:hypothetical protein